MDVIFAVDDAVAWHADNIDRNRDHYSSLAMLGAGAVAAVQRQTGSAHLYFNPYVELPGEGASRADSSGQDGGALGPGPMHIKYGVIEYRDLEDDVRHWRSLYVAGRLQVRGIHRDSAVALACRGALFG